MKSVSGSVLALLLVGLGGCVTSQDEVIERTTPVAQRHPITVEPIVRELRMTPQGNAGRLTEADKIQLAQFARTFVQSSDAKLSVSAPDAAAKPRAGASAASEAVDVIVSAGIPRSRVQLGAYPADGSNAVVVSYVAYVATGPQCGDWSANFGSSPENTLTPNYGCASQHNFAAILADPRDLVTPRTETPADGARRATVLEKYRAGEATQTPRGQGERGVVSDVSVQQ